MMVDGCVYRRIDNLKRIFSILKSRVPGRGAQEEERRQTMSDTSTATDSCRVIAVGQRIDE